MPISAAENPLLDGACNLWPVLTTCHSLEEGLKIAGSVRSSTETVIVYVMEPISGWLVHTWTLQFEPLLPDSHIRAMP
jgi:hypothetical protein